jgi:DNA-binding NarL/FixJ family response regulator
MSDGCETRRIMIVEDEPLISSYIAHVLEELSFEIVGCPSSGAEAIAVAEQTGSRLAIIDIQLSGPMDGIEVAKILRDRFGIATIFLSGAKNRETIERARAVYPKAILQKPFLPSELLEAIQQAFPSTPPTEFPLSSDGITG